MLGTKVARDVWSLAIMIALLGSILMPRAVLCIGPGGHRAIEIVGATGLCPTPAEREQLHERAGDPGCPAGCVDAPIGAGSIAAKESQGGPALLFPLGVLLAPAFSLERPHRAIASALRELARHPSALRTVIIRC
jgi:hypothetical protein